MGMIKRNDYTGEQYECTCDYSYTCIACEAVREEFQRRTTAQSRETWLIEAIQKIAQSLGIELPPVP